jgi:hypothetical protein
MGKRVLEISGRGVVRFHGNTSGYTEESRNHPAWWRVTAFLGLYCFDGLAPSRREAEKHF